jgi:hypothetical protein
MYGDLITVYLSYELSCLFVCFGFYVTSTQYRSFGGVPALLVEEDLRCSSVHYFRHERIVMYTLHDRHVENHTHENFVFYGHELSLKRVQAARLLDS